MGELHGRSSLHKKKGGGRGEGGHAMVSPELAPLLLWSFSKTLTRHSRMVGNSGDEDKVGGGRWCGTVGEDNDHARGKRWGRGARKKTTSCARSLDIWMVTSFA